MRISVGAHQFTVPSLPRTTIVPPTDTLVPRTALVQHVCEILQQHQQLCIVGLPGTGKSSLARLVASTDTHSTDAILWHTFGPQTHQRSSDMYTAWLCCLLACDTLPSDIVPDAATLHQVLAQFPRRIVVCDDIHDAHMLREVRDALPPGTHLLMTTRYVSVAHAVQSSIYHLDGLPPPEAMALLAHRLVVPLAALQQWSWAHDIIHTLAGHPLALTLVAQRLRLLERNPHEWQQFVTPILDGVGQQALSDFTLHPDIAAGFMPLLAYNYHTLNPLEKQILHGMAVCDPNHGVSLRLLMAMWHLNEIQMMAVMERLSAALFVIPETNHTTYQPAWTQHAIMHAYTRMLMLQHQSEQHLVQRLSDAFSALLDADHVQRTYALFVAEYDQCQSIIEYVVKHDLPTAVTLVRGMVWYLSERGQYYTAYEIAHQLVREVMRDGDAQLLTQVHELCALTALGCAIHIGRHRTEYLQTGMHHLHEAQATNVSPYNNVAAQLLMQIGVMLTEIATLPNQDMLSCVEAALRNYERALNAPGLDTMLYVTICQNQANAYMMRAEYHFPNSHDDCRNAIDTCTTGLNFMPTHETEHAYIGLQMTQSSAYHMYATLPHVDTGRYLSLAKIANHEALSRIDSAHQAPYYAQILMNYANLCSELSTCPDVDQPAHSADALDAYQEALAIRTATAVPMEYAWTQHNYADALRIAANISGEPQQEHFAAAWVAIHEALRFRTPQENPFHHALSHYVRAHIAADYATAIYQHDKARALTLVNAGLESYHTVHRLTQTSGIPPALHHGISDYASLLYGILAWLTPDAADTHMHTAFQLNDDVRTHYATDADDDHAEVLAHRLQLHGLAKQRQIATPTLAHDVTAAEALCARPLRIMIACQLHMQLARIYNDVLVTNTQQRRYHVSQTHILSQRLNYAPAYQLSTYLNGAGQAP